MRNTLFTFILFIFTISPAFAQHTNIWGVTNEGGSGNAGVIFRYNYTTNKLDTVYNFIPYLSHWPVAALNFSGSQGKFYGTVTSGGNVNVSTGGIYSFDPLTYSFSLKVDFYPSGKGAFPQGRLFETRPGYFWSVSSGGGAYNYGTVFTYDAVNNTHTTRKSFSGSGDGYTPYDGPILAPNGKMYGITHQGVGTGGGVIYEIDTATYSYAIKHQFAYSTGNQPQGRLLLAADGNIYGATTSGGTYNGGTIFRYNYTTNVLTHLASFSDTTGKVCTGHLIQASDGHIYGVASNGGDSSGGTIFRYNISNNTLAKMASFNPVNTGGYGLGGLCEAPDGLLYGLTNMGGAFGKGTLYAFNITTATIVKKQDFSGANGAKPQFTDLMVATTNTQPQATLLQTRDTLCAGIRDTLVFNVADPDGDTMQTTITSSNNAIINAAATTISRISNTNQYQLIYTAAANTTGNVDLTFVFADGYGAVDSVVTTIYVKDCTPPSSAVAGTQLSKGFNLSPNPASDHMQLRLQDASEHIMMVRLTDALGRTTLITGSKSGHQALAIDALSRGPYVVQVITEKQLYEGRVILK